MKLRKAVPGDIPAMLGLYEEARLALRDMGVDQWQNGYPDQSCVEQDIAEGGSYVLEENGVPVACAYLAFGREPTYEVIREGQWQTDPAAYGFLHRIAVSGRCKGKGAAALFFAELKRQATEKGLTVLRCDTHRDNLPMQRVLAKNGFSQRGIILVEDGTERLAFEFLAGSAV